ncbi:hypothetical protein TSOC_008608 [Tetrabaena socialis]|uniref:Uncharacterized protein n=1 Tax=Tetrabaena socialis TaxID=47790 RepID=A0A2J7ZY06_9CHLO|nr:hypothetical protein TSOC_008608 [Tetrabaena socialis]|eukprot:PNH05150.1 hypothetical protein TSOC_008608 [Tetrabaena socialis]
MGPILADEHQHQRLRDEFGTLVNGCGYKPTVEAAAGSLAHMTSWRGLRRSYTGHGNVLSVVVSHRRTLGVSRSGGSRGGGGDVGSISGVGGGLRSIGVRHFNPQAAEGVVV